MWCWFDLETVARKNMVNNNGVDNVWIVITT